jgi:hypothetical protein
MESGKNLEITPFLRKFTFIEFCVLVVVGLGLSFFADIVRPLWAWEIAPFNAGFLGAIYLGAMVPVGLMYWSGKWSPSRLVLRAIFTFTFIVLAVSLYHFNRFNFSEPSVWVWFALYVGLPASGGYHLWLYRSMPTGYLVTPSRNWRGVLQLTGIALAIYGIGLIFAPTVFSSLFPWTLDSFHSQLYSATFITGAVLMLTVAKGTTRAEFIAAGLTEAIFSIGSITSLVIVDAGIKKIDFGAADTIAWLLLLSILSLLGLAMIAKGVVGLTE